MNNMHHIRVGIIAEDNSDVDSVRILMRRIAQRDNIGVKRFIGKGCGRIKRKCRAWAINLQAKGCRYLVLIHDRDRQNLAELKNDLIAAISPSPIDPFLICIPVEEMEAWWLADPIAIQKALSLDKTPKVRGHPQTIPSPKECIGKLVRQYSKGKTLYLNTNHNSRIAENVNIGKLKSCDSFLPFFNFVKQHMGAARRASIKL